MDILISNVTVVTMNERMEVLFGACIGIEGQKITWIGKKVPAEKPGTIIDGTGMVAMPGLVNCHTHLASTLLRGYFDDTPAQEALEGRLTRQAKLDHRSAKASVLLGLAECLRLGITSVSDLYTCPGATAEAVAEVGIKANIAPAAERFADDSEDFDPETDEACRLLRELTEKWHGYDNGRIRIDAGLYAEYTSNHSLWEAVADFAGEKGLGLQLHLSQTAREAESCLDRTGLYPAELLDCHRLFRVPAAAAGCAALTEEERKLLAKRKASAVLTPLADAKGGQAPASLLQTVKAGMNVALGTGGAEESGSLDLFEVIRWAALSARQEAGRPEALPAAAALMLATTCGARAQGRAEVTGMLKEGMDADIILVDFSAPHLMPCHNVMNGLVFSAKGCDVAMTMVQGRILYQSGRFLTIDLKQVVEELTGYAIGHVFEDNHQ